MDCFQRTSNRKIKKKGDIKKKKKAKTKKTQEEKRSRNKSTKAACPTKADGPIQPTEVGCGDRKTKGLQGRAKGYGNRESYTEKVMGDDRHEKTNCLRGIQGEEVPRGGGPNFFKWSGAGEERGKQ